MFGLVLALTTASLGSAFAYSNRDWMELREGLVDVRLPSVGLIRVPGMVRLRGEYDGGGTVFDLGRSSSRASHHAGDIVLTVSPPHSLSVGIVARDHSGRLEHHVLAIPREVARSMFVGATIVIGLGLALFLVGRVARYVSEVALLRMIDEHADTGVTLTVRQKPRRGWSRTAWRLLFVDCCSTLAVALLAVMLLIQAGLSLALLRSSTLTSRVPDALVTVGLFAVTTSASVIAVAALSLVKHLAWRAAALQSLGALASLRRGCAILRQHLRHAALMQLAMIGVDLVWPIVISPVALVSLALGTILGALCTLLAGSVSGLFVQSVWRWVLAGGLVGVPVLFLTLITPMAALVALRVVFQSCT